jgi:hypothetical protein
MGKQISVALFSVEFTDNKKEVNTMYSKLLKSAFLMFVVVLSVCSINNKIGFAGQNDTALTENIEDKHMKCLQVLAETTIDMLIASRNVIAMNQDLINRDPATGNYSFKGFVPAVVGSQISNNFSLMSGHRLKQTSLRVRNPSNAPDEWEEKVLKLLETKDYSKSIGYGEIIKKDGKKIYRYMKPIYVDVACLQCHGEKGKIRPAIRQYLESKYPLDQAFGYKEGELRGGISIIISPERLGLNK